MASTRNPHTPNRLAPKPPSPLPTHPPDLPVHESTVVQVRNLGDTTLSFTYDRQTYVLAPGDVRFVPYYAAALYFGDPRAVNVGDPDANRHSQHRTHAIDQLSTLYGLYGAPWSTDEPYTNIDYMDARDETNKEYLPRPDGKYYHPHLPYVEVMDANGTTLNAVINDPEGVDVTPAAATSIAESRAVTDQIAALQQQIAAMQITLARSQATTAPAENEAFRSGRTDTPIAAPDLPSEAAPADPTVDAPRRGPGRPRRS